MPSKEENQYQVMSDLVDMIYGMRLVQSDAIFDEKFVLAFAGGVTFANLQLGVIPMEMGGESMQEMRDVVREAVEQAKRRSI